MLFVGACVLICVTTVLVVDSCVVSCIVDTGVEVITGLCVVSLMTVLNFV